MSRIHNSPRTRRGRISLQHSFNRQFMQIIALPEGKRLAVWSNFFRNKTKDQIAAMKKYKMHDIAGRAFELNARKRDEKFSIIQSQMKSLHNGFSVLHKKFVSLEPGSNNYIADAKRLRSSMQLMSDNSNKTIKKILEVDLAKNEGKASPEARQLISNYRTINEWLGKGITALDKIISKGTN